MNKLNWSLWAIPISYVTASLAAVSVR